MSNQHLKHFYRSSRKSRWPIHNSSKNVEILSKVNLLSTEIIIDKSLTLNFTPNGTFTIPLMFNAFSSGMHMPNGPCPDPPDLTGLIRLPTTANCQLYFLTSPNIGILPLYFWLNAIILGICKFKTQVYTLDLNKQTPCKLL